MRPAELESLLEWMSGANWIAPPDEVRERAWSVLGSETPIPNVSARAQALQPSDVRAASTMIDEDRRLVAHSADHLDLSLLVERQSELQGLLSIDGRVWLVDEGSESIDVVWTHQDHVLAHQRIASGESFVFEGAPVHGWTLEIHVPGQPTVVLEDPGA